MPEILLKEVTGLTGTSYTYPQADQEADNGGNPVNYLRIEIEAVRDGYKSWQYQDRAIGDPNG